MKSDTFYGLIVLALGRLPAGVAYLPLIVIWNPLFIRPRLSPLKCTDWAKPNSTHALSSSELRLEVTLCSLVTSRGFWSEFPHPARHLCSQHPMRNVSVMWHTCLCGHLQARKHCAYIQVYRVFRIKLISWLRLNSIFPSVFVFWSLSGIYCIV